MHPQEIRESLGGGRGGGWSTPSHHPRGFGIPAQPCKRSTRKPPEKCKFPLNLLNFKENINIPSLSPVQKKETRQSKEGNLGDSTGQKTSKFCLPIRMGCRGWWADPRGTTTGLWSTPPPKLWKMSIIPTQT